MENIFIFTLLIMLSSVLGVSTINSINADYVFSAIDEHAFVASIDYTKNGYADEYTLSISRVKFENIILEIIKGSKLPTNKFKVEFSYYNIISKTDCIKNNLACNGVELKVTTNIRFFYKERLYIYEIIKQS